MDKIKVLGGETIKDLIADADRAVSALYDELQKTVPRFTSVDMSYLSLGCAFGGEKFAALYFHTENSVNHFGDANAFLCGVQNKVAMSKKYKKHWGTL